jgi:signal transduction histidine kinase
MPDYPASKIANNTPFAGLSAASFRKYPVRQFLIIIVSILFAQLTFWLIFETLIEQYFTDAQHIPAEITFLTITLGLFMCPIIYFYLFQPFIKTINNLQVVQQKLETLNQDLLVAGEGKVQAQQFAEALLAANQALSQSLNLESTTETFLALLFDFVPFDGASILMPTTQSTWSVLKFVHCDAGVTIEDEDPRFLDVESASQLKAIIDEKKPLLIADTQAYDGWQPWTESREPCSWIGFPFIVDDAVIGICELYKACPDFFTDEHIKLVETFAKMATTSIHNARLFGEVQAGRERMKMLSHRLVDAQEIERRYIARELHDEAGQGLASLMVGLGLLECHVNEPEIIVELVGELNKTLDEVSEGLHRLAVGLRPASLDHLGIVPVLHQHVEDFANKYNLEARFESININGRLPHQVETAVYRIVQEGLTNIVRHGQATRADILLHNRDDKLLIIIEDNGIGFVPETVDKAEHLGLLGIAERAEMLNGNLTIESTLGVGTTVLVEVPFETAHTHR